MRPAYLAALIAPGLLLDAATPVSASALDGGTATTPNERRWCFLGIFGDTCGQSTTTTTTTTTSQAPASTSQPPTSTSTPPATTSAPPVVQTTATSAPHVVAATTTTTTTASSAPPLASTETAVVPPTTTTSANATAVTANATGTYDPLARETTYTNGVYFNNPLPTPFAAPASPAWGSLFSYPQPPIPAAVVSADPAIFTASGAGAAAIAQPPQTRTYTFNLGFAAGQPDGFVRSMMVVNGQYPGPLIEANAGDTVVVTVNNGLDEPQSIHWHGMRQNGTQWYDGVPGISQCAIQPGGSFTYRFVLENGEMGTYWWHSHYGNTLADGIVGGLIVHSPADPLKLGRDYDDERITYLSDWMDDQSRVIVEATANLFQGYRGLPIVTTPDAILVNGRGQVDCLHAQAGVPCYQNSPSEITVAAGARVRFRLINTGSHAMVRFSIDGHVLSVVEADDTPLVPVAVHEVPVNVGQRYSVVVTLDQGAAGSSFWIRAQGATFCINPLTSVVGSAILRYTDAQGGGAGAGAGAPTSQPWGDLAEPSLGDCVDLDAHVTLTPAVPEDAPATVVSTQTFNSLFGVFVDKVKKTPYIGFGMNLVTYTNYINNPLLARVMKGIAIPGTEVAIVTFPDPGTADIVINVLDPPPLSHPFHLHGRPFYIVGRGSGAYSWFTSWFWKPNLSNPLRRDTITIPHWSWAILRVKLDDAGVWPLHCHIGWHLSVGKMAVVVVRPSEVAAAAQQAPADWSALCAGQDTGVIGPARKRARGAPVYGAGGDREEAWVLEEQPDLNANGSLWRWPGEPYRGPVTHPFFDAGARSEVVKRFVPDE